MNRISRGDVILCKGNFALAWDTQSTQFIRIFPIVDATDGCAPGDIIIPDRGGLFRRATGFIAVSIRVTQERMVAPKDWLRIPDLALDRAAIIFVDDLIDRTASMTGAQCAWPVHGTPESLRAPIFAS